MKKTSLLAAVAALFLSLTSWGADAWQMDLTVAGYTGTETLTDFPVLVRLPADFPYADCGEGGGTIRFVDAGENLLSHEIDTWNPSGESLIWVKLPTLAPGGTVFTMFFGDKNPLVDTTVDFRQTWSRYAAVVHGGTTITGNTYDGVVFDGSTPEKTGDVHDSSPNDVSVKMFRNGITKTTTDGYLGSCFERSGFTAGSTSLGLGVGNPRLEGRLDDIYKFSISGWYKANATGSTYTTLAGDGKAWQDNTYFWLNESGSYHSFATKNGHNGTSGKWTMDTEWRHFEVTVIDKDYIIQYRDGEAATTSPLKLKNSLPDTSTYNDSHMSFGALRAVADSSNNKNCWMGLMDELRVFNGTASADWVKAEFETASKADFLTAGEIKESEGGPVFNKPEVTAEKRSASVSVSLRTFGKDATSADVYFAYGASADALGEYSLVKNQAAVDENLSKALSGLEIGTKYFYSFIASNNLEKAGTVAGSFETLPLGLAEVGEATSTGANPYVGLIDRKDGTYALIFTNAQTTTFTFNSSWTVKQFLVVGGGGAGGGNVGGGGGGGGVIWFTNTLVATGNITTNYNNGDSISITVGAGGVGGFKASGTAGGHSTLSLGDKTYTAFGGGGGGHYDSVNPVPGADGNTGCGAGVYKGNKTTNGYKTSMPSLSGYYGTNGGDNNGDNATGGGGGAGAAGSNAPSDSMGGKGGDGLACSITGAEIYYAAGGGGGDTSASTKDDRAKGGLGGGGNASYNIGRLSPDASTKAPKEAHATGFGCGGGGGNGGGGHTCVGGNGSAGIVVLLIEPMPSLMLATDVGEVTSRSATISATLTALGEGATSADVYFAYGTSAEALGDFEQVKSGAVAGETMTKEFSDLTPEATYYYAFTATNNASPAEGVKVDGSFTTLALEQIALSGAKVTPGLDSAAVSVTLATVGEDADSAEVSVIWGASAGALANTNVLVAAAEAGQVCGGTIEGLSISTTYYYAFTAKNNLGQSVTTATKSFTTLAPEQLTLTNAKVTPGVTSAEVSVKVDKVGEGASRAEVSVIWGASASALANTNVLAAAAEAGQVCGGTIDGLSLGTTYYYAFTAKNNLGEAVTTATSSFTTLQNLINSVTDVGTSSDPNAYLIDRKDGTYALVFTNAQETTFTFKRQFFITEALVVGGGGSGGGNCGAGGGAGGFVYLDCIETGVDEGSSISLKVGAGGGKPSGKQQRGVNGEDSFLTLGGTTYTSVGGGGGGTWGDYQGRAGGSGGGSGANGAQSGASTQLSTTGYGLGNAGGTGGSSDLGGGGGGAGSSGKAATSERCGDGGWGVECDITGEALFYAAGGGGTSRSKPAGKGGSGIGGDGAPAGARVTAPYGRGCGFPGKDGTGSGGGGGESEGEGWGGAGGSGIVILRISTERIVEVSAVLRGKPGQDGFSLDLTASSDGGDGTGSVSIRGGWSLDAKSIPDGEIAANIPVRTAYQLDVTGLEPGATYHYSFYSVNSRGETSQVATGTVVLRNSAPVPYPTLDVSAAVVGQAIEVDWGSYTGPKVEGGVRWQLSSGTKKTSWVEVAKGDSYIPTPSDYGHWIKCVVETNSSAPVALEKAFYFSKLPVFYMTTDDGKTPTKAKESHDGQVFVQGNGEWSDIYDGTMTIKVRGNSTAQNTNKYSWKLKLGEKAEMFGIPKSKHWVLLANELERTFMRNKLAYDFANEIGSQGMRSLWVECVLNGEHKGLYQFCEHIRVAKDRVNVFDWEGAGEDAADAIAAANGFSEADTAALEEQMVSDFAWVTSGKVTFKSAEYDVAATWKDYPKLRIDGGCLIEMSTEEDETSRFGIASGALSYMCVMVNTPEFIKTNEAMFDACKARMQNYFDACTSVDGYNANGAHWSQLADTDSMAAFFLVLEMFGNDDGAEKSRYLHWDAGKPIVFGPVWDFDWGVGSELVSGEATGWKAQDKDQSFYRDWTDDPWFCTRMRTLYWSKAREPFARIIAEGGEIDDYYEYLYEAAVANEIPFDEQVTVLRNYLTARLAWLDQQFADVPTLMASLKNNQSTYPYTADTTNLAISFENAPTNVIARGTALRLSATVSKTSTSTVGVYVNGLKVGEPVSVASGRVACEIPAAALTEAPGNDNCVSLVARDSSGNVVSRNYALVRTFDENPLGDGYLFVLEGDYTGVQTISPTGAECRVVLNGANVPDGIVLVGSAKFEFKPAEGTVNEVGSITGPTASFKLEGKGTLSLEGPDTLVSVSNLHVKSGTFAVKSTGVAADKTPVVNVLGYAKQSGGTIDVDLGAVTGVQAYGIYIANKNPKGTDTVYGEFADGFFNATVGGVKSAALYGNKGSADVTFKGGETVTATLVGAEARLMNVAGKLKLNGGDFDVTGETSATDARVFKCDREISVKAGTYRVTAAGVGSEIFSTSKNKDGDPSTITVSGGTFELVANDDCFNADDNITVSGGLIYAVSTANDVFDSNGDMLLAGGTILAFATGPDHEAFDVEPMATGDNGIPHVLTVTGGTVFGTGGAGSVWPASVQTGEGVNVYRATGLAASSYSEKYLSIVGGPAGSAVTSAVKLPTFPGATCAIFATCPGMAAGSAPTLSATAPTEGSRDFHELYVWGEQQTYQENLRFHTIYGSTNEGSDAAGTFGDEGEYIILTNVSDQVVSLAGVKVSTAKSKKGVVDTPSCSITLTEGTVPAYGTVRLDQADWTAKGWKKITNGEIVLTLTDAYGIVIQSGMASFNLYEECDGGGAALVAKRFDNLNPLEATTDDWKSSSSSTGEIDVMPGHPAEVAAADAASAVAAVVLKVEVPTDGQGAAVVEESAYKGYFKLVAVPVPGETGLYSVSAVLDETLVRPVIAKTVEIDVPFTVDEETSEVTVAAKKGLYYSLLRGATLDAIETVVDAKLATGETVTLTDADKLQIAAFYRVAVSFAL